MKVSDAALPAVSRSVAPSSVIEAEGYVMPVIALSPART